jgi:hypothetical protein
VAKLINLDNLPTKVKEFVEPYATKLIQIHQDNLKCIMVYGSATQYEDFVPKRSNINLLVILGEINIQDLKKSAKLVTKGEQKKKIIPLFLTLRHINTSSDVFPIEFLEMKENNTLIYGEDVFKEVEISDGNIRLQCEEQLKGKLIRLRQAYLELGAKHRALEQLMIDSLTSLMPILRNLIRLKGKKEPPIKKRQIISTLSEEYDIAKSPLLKILESKLGITRLAKDEIEPIFEQYLEILQKLAIATDQLKV